MSVPPIIHHSISNFHIPHSRRILPNYIIEARNDEYYEDNYEREVKLPIPLSRHHEQPIKYARGPRHIISQDQ